MAAIIPDRRRVTARAVRQWGEQGSGVASTVSGFAAGMIPFTPQN